MEKIRPQPQSTPAFTRVRRDTGSPGVGLCFVLRTVYIKPRGIGGGARALPEVWQRCCVNDAAFSAGLFLDVVTIFLTPPLAMHFSGLKARESAVLALDDDTNRRSLVGLMGALSTMNPIDALVVLGSVRDLVGKCSCGRLVGEKDEFLLSHEGCGHGGCSGCCH